MESKKGFVTTRGRESSIVSSYRLCSVLPQLTDKLEPDTARESGPGLDYISRPVGEGL